MKEKEANKKQSAGRKKITFEKALENLEDIVKKMEGGELSLEDSLKLFQDGIEYAKKCRELLADAEYRVEYLLKEELERSMAEGGNNGKE